MSEVEDLRDVDAVYDASMSEGDALRYDTEVDLSDLNTARAQLVLLAGHDQKVLEAGPATGYITKALEERGCRVTGVEIDPVAARRAAPHAERMIVGDIEVLDFEKTFGGDRFDVVMFGDVLEHLVHPNDVLMRVRSILAPDGCIVASVPNVAHGSVRLALLAGHFDYTPEGLLDRTHLRFFTRRSLDSLFRESGYRIATWGRTTADLFGTELGLREEDFPPRIVEAIRALPDVETYQFLLKAQPRPEISVAESGPGEGSREMATLVGPLHEVEEQLNSAREGLATAEAHLSIKGRLLLEKQQLLTQREHQLRLLQDETRWLRDVVNRAEGELERTRDELGEVTGSAAYRVSQGLTRRGRRWFPRGTIRGQALAGARRFVYRSLNRDRQDPAPPASPAVSVKDPAAWVLPDTTPQPYVEWIDRYEPKGEDLDRQRELASRLPHQPLVSILIPTWNPPPGLLRETLESVRAQTYGNWEICIADGASSQQVRDMLTGAERSDPRIRIRLLEANEGISGNTNEALALAHGDYVAFLDQTDLLAPFALYEVARALNQDPGSDILYSDWDIISEDGRVRFNPFFSPSWSPDLLLSSNYMSHLLVVRKSLVDEVGKLRPSMDGAQDWDLLLRLSERTGRLSRIPKILYHWRADQGSAAMSLVAKPEAEANQRRAVEEHLERRSLAGSVERTEEGHLRIRWDVTGNSKVSIIIPTRDNRSLLVRCLEGIGRSSYPNVETIVIETGGRSSEKEAWYRAVESDYSARVLWWNDPFNYSSVNNWAAGQATGDILLFLNDDTEPMDREWLQELVGWIEQAGAGVVGAHLVHQDGVIQHGGVVIGLRGFADHLFAGLRPGEWSLMGSTMWYRNLTAVTGACLAIRRDLFDQVGGWDERFELCGSDVELCLRVRRSGHRVICTPFARVRHVEAATRGGDVPEGDFFCSLWHYQRYLYGGDPYFNPNLAYSETIPRLRTDGDQTLPRVSAVIGRDLTPSEPKDDGDEARALAEVCRVTREDLDAVLQSHRSTTGERDVTTVNWFIPDFENPFYGGIHTIFRFADHFQRTYGVKNRFVVLGTGPEQYIRSGLKVAFPDLTGSDVFSAEGGSDEALAVVPDADASIATLWVTAYPLARHRTMGRRFYFVQDFEPMFYPAGAQYALAEETYRFGFYGVANTPPLKQIYEGYGSGAVAFTPCVDAELFHARRPPRPPDEPFTVFMYGRPGHPRNCYELAVTALGRLKSSLKDRVRIVTAGSWAHVDGETPSWLQNMGMLGYDETADLYRRCDAGLVLSVSKHPTYIPLQLMACGALVVANDNPANGWVLRDGENCLLSEPTVDRLSETLERGLLDRELRSRLTTRARADIQANHSDWTPEIDRVYRFLCDPEGRSQ